MSEEKESCVGEFCAASILPTGEEKIEEVKAETEEKEKLDEASAIAITLGALTSTCNISPDETKEQCFRAILPLETKESDSKTVIKEIIELQGIENLEKSVGAFREMIVEVKKELIEEGKLPPEELKEEVKE